MSVVLWIAEYVLFLLFWTWIIRFGGAELLEGRLAAGCAISIFAPRWSAEGIKAAGWVSIVLGTIWFVVGLFSPSSRF